MNPSGSFNNSYEQSPELPRDFLGAMDDAESPDSQKKKKRKREAGDSENDRFAEIDSLLAQKRKPRMKTSCHPCRKRKVGCDRQIPCHTCVERRHPEFCVYESAEQRPFVPGASSTSQNGGDIVTVPKKTMQLFLNKVEHLESLILELKTELRMSHGLRHGSNGTIASPSVSSAQFAEHYSMSSAVDRDRGDSNFDDDNSDDAKREGLHTNNLLTGQTVHVGGHSIPALFRALIKGQGEGGDADWSEFMTGSVLPMLGLDNETATYPFLDLWASPDETLNKVKRIADMLPEEEECSRLFGVYKNVSHVVFPGVANLDKFEQQLLQFHLSRSQESRDSGIDEQTIYGKSLTWISLLFAILASGCHFSDFYDRRGRQLTSKAFICCSFECLRLTNFLSHPTLESLQAMLVFLNVLLNMYNAGVSWAMLGLCIRLAQSMGLHKETRTSTPNDIKNERAKVWWAILWQDSLISIIYDRGGCVIDVDHSTGIPPEFDAESGHWKFERCMYEVCRIGLEVVRERDHQQNFHEVQLRMEQHERELSRLETSAAPWMKDLQYCNTIKDRTQNLIFTIHKSYLMSEIFRATLNPNAHKTERALRMRQVCIDNLAKTINAWSDLLRFGGYPNRSWPAMHRALSSALLLGILRVHERDPKVLALLNEFLRSLEDTIVGVDPLDIPDPLKRSLHWIKKIILPKSSNSTSSSPSLNLDFDLDGSPMALLNQMMFPTGLTP